VITISVAVVGVPIAIAWIGNLRINLTPSEPLGLWRIEPMDRAANIGDLIFICPPQTSVFAAARDRGYLRAGLCPAWVAPLIKMVAATSGQHVTVTTSVVIDNRPLANSNVRARDGAGRPLAPWSGGTIPPGHLYLHSPLTGSYDSRYFGPVPETGVLGRARPILTFDP